MKIVKSFEESGLWVKGVSKIIEKETENKKVEFLAGY